MEIAICGNLKEKISEFFVQTFSLLFFPGDNSFSQNKNKSGNVINISANKNTDNNIEISVNICYNKKTMRKSGQFCSSNDIVLATGKIFYGAASELTGICPPWGIHTGIRPAKAAGD
ncbi:MAG: hypothetical protein FWD71_23695, partial [Oscillospiraceae bacterium]|nr:hypothetical protein [Oscillospiraceae bacterium]